MNLRLPNFWRGMSFTAKAGYLCSSNQARDYSHACSLLAKMRKPRPVKPTPQQFAARMEQLGLF